MTSPIPQPNNIISLYALQAMLREGTVLSALEVFNQHLGDIFRLSLPSFQTVMLAGPEAARFVLVSARDDLRWRSKGDPVTNLLRNGVLVIDGDEHDAVRRTMNPALHGRMFASHIEAFCRGTDQIIDTWRHDQPVDMLDEMRKIALLVLLETLYKVDFRPDMERLWQAVLKTLRYISPGLWLIWRGIPRPGYTQALHQMDVYLYEIIRLRRLQGSEGDDLLGLLIQSGADDNLIRDQLLTMLIAGHDTSTALLSWTLYLLGKHPNSLEKVQTEVDRIMGSSEPTYEKANQLPYLNQVINEALRLYPPIHLGSRIAAVDLEWQNYIIPAGTRVMYSIYLTHRQAAYWPNPHRFEPERFAPENKHQPYTFLPFGGGPRNCIGAAYAQIEAKIVLARLLQRCDLALLPQRITPKMGATLEPKPGIRMLARRRK